ncbi:MAG TPA: hypothetical protein VHD76_08115 [Bryobacteraceae bacterium]|jgi:hypothetical protein|nr:hypothetical protein [Bryobacteraceae bacterium]
MICLGIVVNFHESKSTRFTAESVSHYIHAVDGYAGLFEECLYVAFSGGVWQIAYEKFHFELLNCY